MARGVSGLFVQIHLSLKCRPHNLHLPIQVAEVLPAKIMQNVSFPYSRWINRRQRRSGHLFQGRYKAIVVDADCYLQELVRYVYFNPVRAPLVTDP